MCTYSNPEFCLPSLKIAWDLVYLDKIKEILRNLIGCLEDWELGNTAKSRKIKCKYTFIYIHAINRLEKFVKTNGNFNYYNRK